MEEIFVKIWRNIFPSGHGSFNELTIIISGLRIRIISIRAHQWDLKSLNSGTMEYREE